MLRMMRQRDVLTTKKDEANRGRSLEQKNNLMQLLLFLLPGKDGSGYSEVKMVWKMWGDVCGAGGDGP